MAAIQRVFLCLRIRKCKQRVSESVVRAVFVAFDANALLHVDLAVFGHDQSTLKTKAGGVYDLAHQLRLHL